MKPSHLHIIAALGSILLVVSHAPRALAGDDEEDEEAPDEEDDADDEAVSGGEEADDVEQEGEADEKEASGKEKANKSKARLLVPVSVEGATVVIDGEEIGKTPVPPVSGLTVGTHQIDVIKEGFKHYSNFIDIPEEGTVRHDVKLEGGRKKVKVPKFLKAWWFWTAIGVVVVTGATVGIAVAAQPEEPNAVHFPPY